MKKVVTAMALLVFVLVTIVGAFAAVGTEREHKTIERTWNKDETRTIEEVHRVVSGKAEHRLGNFLRNDWDKTYAGSWSKLTSAEKAYLNTLNLSAGPWWYIDLTTQTVSTSMFKDYSDILSTETIEEYVVEEIDPFTTIITKVLTTVVTYKNVSYQLILQVWDGSPLVLDLDNNGKIDTAKNDWRPHAPKFHMWAAKFFDISGDNSPDFTEWMMVKPQDGLLAIPEDGKVESAIQLFGTAGGFVDGYEKLSIVCDKDKNGWVEGQELEGLKIWIDENNDAQCQPDELKNLEDYNIKRISTHHDDFVSQYETSDGQVRTTWDWWPAVMETRKFQRK